jgi:integrative and conjugative element protein (TIGR02256 family)
VSSGALDRATADARAAFPLETGGILLGFRTPELIVITRTVTVPDPQSSRRTYLRRRSQAQSQMTAALHDAPPVVGYIGEWHTHPADHPPSSIDTNALGATARTTPQPVALIVLARITDEDWRHHGVVAHRDDWPIPVIAPVRVWPTALTITAEDIASLENAAASAAHPAQETP